MASEKRTSLNFSVIKGGQTIQQVVSLTENLVGTKIGAVQQSVPTTSWTALNLGTVTAPDLLCVVNSDATNYVELAIANDDSGIFAKLTAARCLFLPVASGATIYGRAHTAACVVTVVAVEA